ncbi:uncharacterized protein BYT42DRAFT_574336 [Radiomyces spectabilis]|uniref:uncharacterized protein n=1 Tax=Radiomyces spectabilis TaxID=64574 RepID=UPI002220E97D|nr:uncharacterized protein BYT42DRAFT_574336 [Radiomyces spectabilis]KAI8376365.1 hypothetical protein BYT42DRAFT_574336 [Radiomyces spectabilis]
MATDSAAIKDSEATHQDLYSLVGGVPPIAFVKPTYKTKYNTKRKAEPWVLQSFTNPARPDDLVLQHWIKASEAETSEYSFAKFNKVIDVIEYSNEEYEKYLTDPEWTKEETDYLFDLCRRYDLRFPVIADRYQYNDSSRSIEDLKDRYCSVYRALLRTRSAVGDGVHDRQTIVQQYAFDKAKEMERKQMLLALFDRTAEQVEEEEALFIEARRIEQNEMRLTRGRESLLNSLQLEQAQQAPSTPMTPIHNGPSTGGPLSTPGGIGIAGGTSSAPDTKKKKKSIVDEASASKKARRISNASAGIAEEVPEKKEKLVPGVYVRSQKLPGIKPTMQQRVLKLMADLHIGARPVMPTEQVCRKYEHLQNTVLNLFELKKALDKMEADQKKGASGSAGGREKRRKV